VRGGVAKPWAKAGNTIYGLEDKKVELHEDESSRGRKKARFSPKNRGKDATKKKFWDTSRR